MPALASGGTATFMEQEVLEGGGSGLKIEWEFLQSKQNCGERKRCFYVSSGASEQWRGAGF
jgi:hypothetical protein